MIKTPGPGLADATRAALAKRGTKEVLYEGLSRGEKDFNALVTKIGALKPDVVSLRRPLPTGRPAGAPDARAGSAG